MDEIVQGNPRNNFDTTHQKVENIKKVFIVGNLMSKNINGTGISKTNSIKARPHSWATTVDVWNYIKPELRHKPDVIIIHCETSDIEN